MPSCVFRRCINYTGTVKEKNISFHVIPKKGPVKEKWLNIIRTQRCENDWMPTAYSTVCSDHFLAQDIYVTEKNFRRIKKSAVPVIKEEDRKISIFPNSLEQDSVSDSDSILDYPRKASLKRNSRKQNDKRMRNYKLMRKNQRLKEKCSSLKNILTKLQEKKYLSIDQVYELDLKAEAVELCHKLIQKKKDKRCRQKYTPALKKFAVTLHYYSVAAYKYARQVFNNYLPHPRLIGRWYENSSGDPGFNNQALDILKYIYNSCGSRIICALIADEMPLRHQNTWIGTKAASVVDFGAGPVKSCEIATQAYVFTLVCMKDCWKIPIAYFLVNGISAEMRANLLKICLSQCYNIGVDIVAITFDGCAANINAANLLGCDLKHPSCLKTTFKHPECDLEVAIMLDASHMMKLVRNSLKSEKIIFDENGKRIRWQLLINLIKFQKNVGLNFSSKISARYIYFRNEIMKVKLATHIMSMSVANTLELCNDMVTSSLFRDTAGTINFITIFNNLFDIMNSKSSKLYGLKRTLSAENADEVLLYLEKAKQYILGLTIFIKYRRQFRQRESITMTIKKIVETENKTGFLGFLVCIESLKYLYTTLVESKRLQYIATYRMASDNLEILFGGMRRQGGYNNNPNATQFKSIFKKIYQHLDFKSLFLGNCTPLVDIPMLMCSSPVENINSTVSRRAILDETDSINLNSNKDSKIIANPDNIIDTNAKALSEILNSESVKKTTELIIGYISGWVSRKLVIRLKCETCIDSLISNEKLWFHKFIVLKTMGGLCFSSTDVFKICMKSESIIKNLIKEMGNKILVGPKDIKMIKNRILKAFVGCNDVFESLNSHSLEQHPTFNHRLHIIRAVIDKFINVRLHFANNSNSNSITNNKSHKEYKLCFFDGFQLHYIYV